MNTTIHNFGTVNFNDHHRDITINTSSSVSDILKAVMAEDVEEVTSEPTSPSPKDIWGIPPKGKYTKVREYIEDRKKGDPQFKDFCLNHSLRDICEYLTKEFGWFVDDHSLGANLNRNR